MSTAVLSDLLPFPQVQYAAGGFLEKNRDTLPANVRGLFINSITPLLSVLFTGKSLCTSMSQGLPWQELSVGMRLMCSQGVSQLAAPGGLCCSLNWGWWHVQSCLFPSMESKAVRIPFQRISHPSDAFPSPPSASLSSLVFSILSVLV